jgi:hypothetical protein
MPCAPRVTPAGDRIARSFIAASTRTEVPLDNQRGIPTAMETTPTPPPTAPTVDTKAGPSRSTAATAKKAPPKAAKQMPAVVRTMPAVCAKLEPDLPAFVGRMRAYSKAAVMRDSGPGDPHGALTEPAHKRRASALATKARAKHFAIAPSTMLSSQPH